MEWPFTIAELRSALQLVMPAAAAARFVDSWSSATELASSEFVGHGVTGDTLILLSFLSDDLRRRVEEYLTLAGAGPKDAAWLARRAEVERALRQAGRLP